MPRTKSAEATRAEAIIAGGTPAPGELKSLAKKLKGQQRFGLARRLLRQRFDEKPFQGPPGERLDVGRQLAICTYKDPDLPADERHDAALWQGAPVQGGHAAECLSSARGYRRSVAS